VNHRTNSPRIPLPLPAKGTVAVSTKQAWMIWLAPAAAWSIYMCWLAGYRSGFEQGHAMAWDSAHQAFANVEKPLLNHYQWVALAAKNQSTDHNRMPDR
jgi:hypothetical protein